MRKKWLTLVLAVLCIASIGVGCGMESKVPTEPTQTVTIPERTQPTETTDPELWRSNVLRSDEIPDEYDGVFFDYPVFGSGYQRSQISSVTFLDTLADIPADAWDVSEAGNSRVMAWVKPNGELYDLYIGAEGGISAGSSSAYLFAGYTNAVRITLGDHFATYDVQDMQSMFHYCKSLEELTLGKHFDTSNVQDMNSMFHFCDTLANLTLGEHFDTSNVQDMSYMFAWCPSLTKLTLGDKFVTANADTTDLFLDSPIGADYQHLLH